MLQRLLAYIYQGKKQNETSYQARSRKCHSKKKKKLERTYNHQKETRINKHMIVNVDERKKARQFMIRKFFHDPPGMG